MASDLSKLSDEALNNLLDQYTTWHDSLGDDECIDEDAVERAASRIRKIRNEIETRLRAKEAGQ